MAGHRLTAHLIHSALAEKALTPRQFLPLPLVDGPLKAPPAAPNAADNYDEFKARLAAQNAQKQATQAAT
jgi:hypothetical protein